MNQRSESDLTHRIILCNMRHELRTPLNAIIGYSEMLIENAEDSGQEDLVSGLKKIYSAGTETLRLLNEVLAPAEVKLENSSHNPD